ncbi:MAG TPA: transposase [bacterium]|nr:transposase [bacterium]HQL63918.1 transposase [bacterium]
MRTECTGTLFDFQPLEKPELVALFDEGRITSDAGGLLLREEEQRCGILRQFSGCFRDSRDAERIEHTVAEWVARIVERVRARWPKVEIAIQGDAGFCRESIGSPVNPHLTSPDLRGR